MAKYTSADIRNVALVGGAGAGKTTLLEALLHKTGVIPRRGNVADGSSLVDYDPDEKEKRHSLYMKLFHFSADKHEYNVFDTPGYPDYIGEVMQALSAVEIGALCINAATGVTFHAHRIWDEIGKSGRAKLIVVTHCDAENSDSHGLIASIREHFGAKCVPVNLPNEDGASVNAVIDILGEADPPEGGEGLREQAIESIVTLDDDVMEQYLETAEVSHEDVARLLTKGIALGEITPILFTSAEKDIGLQKLIHFLAEDCPSPLQGPFFTAGEGDDASPFDPNEHSEFASKVFKTLSDPFVGRLSYIRVVSGEIKSEDQYLNVRVGKPEKMGHILRLQGKEQETVDHAQAGDIVAVAKAESMETGDTLTVPQGKVEFASLKAPSPMVSLSLSPKNRNDEQKMSGSLKKMLAEDPTLRLGRDEQTGELVLSGLSELHIQTMLKRMKARFKVEVDTKIPRVPLRETIVGSSEGHHRHKKQSGGRGQFGEVYLRIEPKERGEGYEFSDDTFGGSVPKQYVPAVDKGIQEQLGKGVVAGYQVVDVKVSLYDGKAHDVDSDEASFKMAGQRAFRDAFEKAKPCLLEPIVNLEVLIPGRFMGDINSDLNGRRGRINGMDTIGEMQVIKAEIPLKEVQTYAADLRSLTQGEGSFTFEFSHYDVVPHNVADEFIKAFKAGQKPEED